MSDPTKMRNQPALTTSSGRTWVIVGAFVTAICVGMLLVLAKPPTVGLAVFAIVADVVLYACMIAVHLTVKAGTLRLWVIAVLYGLIVAITLVVVIIIAVTTAAELASVV